MAISSKISYAPIDELYLDPLNPRLGRSLTAQRLPQLQLLDVMKDWVLEELAVSFLESGAFWVHEALLVVEESLYSKKVKVVVEGNRRLAALKLLKMAVDGKSAPKSFYQMVKDKKPKPELFKSVPYILVDARKDVEAFLGFRHVTGIKEWQPAEKAEYIAKMIDGGMSYEEVRRKIGSRTPTVRNNYVSFKLLLQIDSQVQSVPDEKFENRFSVLYLSLRTQGVQDYLGIDVDAHPTKSKLPVAKSRHKQLENYAIWMFGTETKPPLFSDSRLIDNFGRILQSPEAVKYLESGESPSFDVALRLSGGDEIEIVRYIEMAAEQIELALSRVHHYKSSKKIGKAIERLERDYAQLLEVVRTSNKSAQP